MAAPWWRRNRLWLALLGPLLVLALTASSFRLVTLYLPWQWSRPIVVGGPVGTLTQAFAATDGSPLSRTVTVGVDALRPVDVSGDDAAASGARLWEVTLTLEAAPDQVLDGCTVELVDAVGTRYATSSAGKVAADPTDRYWRATDALACVPEDAPGPVMGFAGVEPATVTRPDTWTLTAAAAIPEGVTPVTVRIMWTRPVYLELTPDS